MKLRIAAVLRGLANRLDPPRHLQQVTITAGHAYVDGRPYPITIGNSLPPGLRYDPHTGVISGTPL